MQPSGVDGLLVVDKPTGPTSHDVVARVRRVLGENRIGHTGTLDPLATGVLALVVGRATRLAQFMGGDTKAYDATVRLGIATDTYDAEGAAVGEPVHAPWPARETVVGALDEFSGTRLQQPPLYSAKKVGGRRSYDRARKREAATDAAVPVPEPVPVTLQDCVVNRYEDGILELSIECSAGFYVRSLAHDLGVLLGTGAHLTALRRTRSGAASLAQAVRLDEIEASPDRAVAALVPMAAMLSSVPAVVLTESGLRRVAHGNPVGRGDLADGAGQGGVTSDRDAVAGTGEPAIVRLFSPAGTLVAIARPAAHSGILHPSVVLM